MPAGRPQLADPGSLYSFAHLFYWDLRRIAEGRSRWFFDEEKYRQLTGGLDNVPLIDDEDRTRYQQIVDEEIRNGRLQPTDKEKRLRDIEDAELFVRRDWYCREKAEEARREIKVPGEPDVIEVLLNPTTKPEQIRELCKEAFMNISVTIGSETRDVTVPAWPIAGGSTLPMYLSKYAEQYVAALKDPRFPRCDLSKRPSTQLKQLWFVSRALAGALFSVKTRTAVNLVGSLRPEQAFQELRNAKPTRGKRRTKKTMKKTIM